MEAWEALQSAMQPVQGVYDKQAFVECLQQMTPSEFNRFCRSYLHLMEFYNRNKNAWVTDDWQLIKLHRDLFWRPGPIDYDKSIQYNRVL